MVTNYIISLYKCGPFALLTRMSLYIKASVTGDMYQQMDKYGMSNYQGLQRITHRERKDCSRPLESLKHNLTNV